VSGVRRARILIVALALLGCRDGDSDATTTSTTASTTTEAASPAIALRGDGLAVAALGASPDPTVAAVSEELGEPSLDTGWEPSISSHGTCPGEQIRAVEWGGLVLLFTDGTTAYGSGEHLFTWRVSDAPPPVATVKGLGYGATAADAEELYPGQVEELPAEDPFPAFLQIQAEGGQITAYLDEADTITNLEAGATCGE
jgi:hypothetical protein